MQIQNHCKSTSSTNWHLSILERAVHEGVYCCIRFTRLQMSQEKCISSFWLSKFNVIRTLNIEKFNLIILLWYDFKVLAQCINPHSIQLNPKWAATQCWFDKKFFDNIFVSTGEKRKSNKRKYDSKTISIIQNFLQHCVTILSLCVDHPELIFGKEKIKCRYILQNTLAKLFSRVLLLLESSKCVKNQKQCIDG